MVQGLEAHRRRPGAANSRRAARLILGAALLIAPLATAQAEPLAASCPRSYQPQTLDATQQPINLGQLKNQIYYYLCSGAYDSELNAVLTEAQAYVEKRAGEVSKPAIVLDIDETSLSNLPQEFANDLGFITDAPCDKLPKGPCGFSDWMRLAAAKPIPGTLALFNAAKARNVAVFFITGRRESEDLRAATAKNLQAAGYDGWAGLILRPPSAHNMTIVGYKSGERGKIAAQGFTIIANVGDQQSDLDGGFAERVYKLPNPIYYLP